MSESENIKITEEEWLKIFRIRDAFSEKIRGKPLYEPQKQFSNMIIRSVILQRGETFLSQWTRQFGKTTIISDTIAFLLVFYFPLCARYNISTTPFFNIGFFAPQDEQAKTDFKLLKDTLKLLESKGIRYAYDEKSMHTISIPKGKYPSRLIYAFTASPTSHPESKTLNLIILEESQDLIDQQVDKAIIPMGASTNATEVWIGVSGYQKCRFWELRQSLPDSHKIIVTFEDALKIQEKLFKATGDPFYQNYKKHIEKRIREIGQESDEFNTQYAMKWMLEKGQFITYEKLMLLEDDYLIRPDNYPRHLHLYAGIDWGKMHDSTVLTIINMAGQIVAWYSWQGDEYSSQIEEIVFLLTAKYKAVDKIWCDATGTQDMAVDVLRAECRKARLKTQVIGYKFTAQSKDFMYKNLSRLMHDKMMGVNVIEPSFLRFPAEKTMKGIDIIHKERFIKQFVDLQKEIKNNMWRCAHPEGPNYHDDYCDSLALACIGFDAVRSSYKPVMA